MPSAVEPLYISALHPVEPQPWTYVPIITRSDGHVSFVVAAAPSGITREGGGSLDGTDYGDTLTATEAGTLLHGHAGNDTLRAAVAGAVFDVAFIGSVGDDLMIGSYGQDRYLYGLGHGHDVIVDDVRAMGPDVAAFFAANPGAPTYQDRLFFDWGVATWDVQPERVGEDLVLRVRGDQGSVTIDGWYDGTMFNKIERVEFFDGTTWLASEIDHRIGQASAGMVASAPGLLFGSQYDDLLTATGSGRLHGDLGNDLLVATVDGAVFGVGFEGGRGNDTIHGSYAGDVYYFSRGDGHDTVHDDVRVLGPEVAAYFAANLEAPSYQDRIEFGMGIGAGDLRFSSEGDDLVVRIAGADDSIRFAGWNDGTLFNRIETFSFYGGMTLTHEEVDQRAGQPTPGVDRTGTGDLWGTQAGDVLTATGHGTRMHAGGGADVLQAAVDGGVFGLLFHGGTGADLLRGSYAGDTYLYLRGDGHDVIDDDVRSLGTAVADYFLASPFTPSYQDELRFGAGIAAADVSPHRTADDALVLRVHGTEGSIRVEGWFDGTPFQKIERIAFDDGTAWGTAEIDARLGTSGHPDQVMPGRVLVGSNYDDMIRAQGFATLVDGGAGDDTIVARVDGSVFDLTFIGGAGNDSLQGSYGRDFYRFDAGDGHDVIHDDVRFLSNDAALYFEANPHAETYQDHLMFGAGIDPWSMTRSRVGDDLVLGVGANDSVTVTGWFDGSGMNKIEVIAFAGGHAWSAAMVDYGL